MAQIKCKCGNIYDQKFKFCPECAAPNPVIKKKTKLSEVSLEVAEKPVKKKFKKIGEDSLTNEEPVRAKKSYDFIEDNDEDYNTLPEDQEDLFADYEDDDDDTSSSTFEDSYEESYDYEDEDDDTPSDEYEDYEDEDEVFDEEAPSEDDEDDNQATSTSAIKANKPADRRVLTAPSLKSLKRTTNVKQAPKPAVKKVSSTKSSLGKKAPYDPNHDGYYDDKLPATLNEATKTTHLDVLTKAALSVVCIAGLIAYCIFYVQV